MIDFSKLLEEDAADQLKYFLKPDVPVLLSIAISTKRIADTLDQLVVHSHYGRPQLNTGSVE